MRIVRVVAMAAVLAMCAAAADVQLELHLKRQTREETIEKEFAARSTPGSPKYKQHLTVAELAELVKPVPGAASAVRRYLAATAGVSAAGEFATGDVVTATVESDTPAATTLGLAAWAFAAGRRTGAGIAVPAELAAFVDYVVVAPTQAPRRAGPAKPALDFPGMVQTPPLIYQRYNVPSTLLDSETVVQAVGEFYPMGYGTTSLNELNARYGLPNPPMLQSGPNAGGLRSVTQPFEEGPLDVQYITALAPNATTWWIAGNATATWATMANHIMLVSPMPLVVSISWSSSEAEYLNPNAPVSGIPAPLTTANDAFRKLGLLGVSVLSAAGDYGTATWAPGDCSRFGPNYPASSPYVTSVGSTFANTASGPEQAVGFSGGGFSDYFTTPTWQTTQVQAYLQQGGVPPTSYFNATGRGYPDVSAVGTNYQIFVDSLLGSQLTTVSGTSASTPAFAAVLTRVKAAQAAAGKSPIGFLNPTLYQLNKVGQDVTTGASQNGCPGPNDGFPATAGWDAVTGLGTPNYTYLAANL